MNYDDVVEVRVKNKVFSVNIDVGIQDVVWLAKTACFLYGEQKHIKTRLIPSLVQTSESKVLHPKSVLLKIVPELTGPVVVSIRPPIEDPTYTVSKREEDWMEAAFGEKQNIMKVKGIMHLKTEIYNDEEYKANFSYSIFPNLKVNNPLFAEKEVLTDIKLEKIGDNMLVSEFEVPFGQLALKSVTVVDKEGKETESTELMKNVFEIKTEPEPFLPSQKEEMIRKKEGTIRTKENSLKTNIRKAEQEIGAEMKRQEDLQAFMDLIPFSLKEIKDYTTSRLDDSDEELEMIFEGLEEDESKPFRKLFEIFRSYVEFELTEESEPTLGIDSLMHIFKDIVEDKETSKEIYFVFRKFYNQNNFSRQNFKIFCYSFVHCLNHLVLSKNIDVVAFLDQFIFWHDSKLASDEKYRLVFSESYVREELKDEIDTYRSIFYARTVLDPEMLKYKVEFREIPGKELEKLVLEIKDRLEDDKLDEYCPIENRNYSFWEFVLYLTTLSDFSSRDEAIGDSMRLETFNKVLSMLN